MNSSSRAAGRIAFLAVAALVIQPPLLAQGKNEYPESLQEPTETPWIYEGSDVPRDEEWRFGRLDNGLRYGVRNNGVPPGQVSIRVRIDAGSLHEADGEQGYAHLLEHLLFRESRYLGPAQAIPTWQRLGATFGNDTNAETSPTHTVYKLDLPDVDPAKLDESMKLLSGMVREPVLSDANVQTEVPIVLAEKRERGGPQERATEITMQTLFAGQRLADRITIGTEETLRGATGASVAAFHARWYRPENTVISVVGDLDPVLFAQMIEKHFSDWKVAGKPAAAPAFGDPVAPRGANPANPVGDVAVIVEPTLPRALTYGWFRPWRQVEDTIVYNEGRLREQLALQLINRRLEARARAGGSYLYAQASEDKISRSTHATIVQVAPLSEDWQTALRDVRGVIADAVANPPTQEEMDRELAEMEIAFSNIVEQRSVLPGSGFADDLVNAVDIREALAAPETFLMVFNSMREKATPTLVQAETRKLFSGNVVRGVYMTPETGEASKEAVRTALLAPVKADTSARLAAQTVSFDELPAIGEPGTVASRQPLEGTQAELVTFANGVTAILLANDYEPGRVSVRVRFGAGMQAFGKDDAPYITLGEGALVDAGVGTLNQEALDRLRTGRKIGFDFEIDEGTFAFSAQTRRQDLTDQLYLFAAKLGMPRWDPAPILRMKAASKIAYQAYGADPAGVVNRDLATLVSGGDPRRATATPAEIDATTVDGFRQVWEPILASGPIEVLIFGDYDKDEAVAALTRTFGALPARTAATPQIDSSIPTTAEPGETVVRTHRGSADQAAAVVAWPSGAGVANLRESRQLNILTDVFNNRLMDALRERAGASYAPVVVLDWPVDVETGGKIMALAQLQPDDVPVFFAEAERIAAQLAAAPPSQDELDRVTEPLRNQITRASSGSYFYLTQLQGASRDPRRVDALRGILEDYSRTTPEQMLALGKKYFGAVDEWRFAVIPEGQSLATASTDAMGEGR